MKFTILIALSLVTQIAFAALSTTQQKALVDQIAKEHRRQLHIDRNEDVGSSNPALVTKSFLDKHYNERENHSSALDRTEYAQLYSCLNNKSCALWHFSTWSSYMSGSGQSSHFILINIYSGKYEEIINAVYEE